MKQEKLSWLANYPFHTKRFGFYVGGRCRNPTIWELAKDLHLDWKRVKSLEKQYMRELLGRAGTPGSKVLGIDEVSLPKGHTYR